MLALTSKSLTTTLFVYLAIVLAVTTVVEAHESPIHHRDHANLKRLIRKRSPQLSDLPPVIGAAPTPSSIVSSTTTSSTTSASASASASLSASSASASQSASSSASVSTSASSSASSTSSSSSTTSSSSETPSQTPTQPENTPTVVAPVGSTVTKGPSTKTLVTSVDAEETSPPQMAGAAAEIKSNVLTILIAVAASIGGLFILWTVFRKWKFGSSKKFDQRLQPIDWQPHGANDDDIVPANRRNSNSSFHSSGHGHSRPTGSPLPDHDFTAGPALSPVGGYADLARGPSPQPQMHDLHRGPSFNGGFDAGVPLHHQSGYSGARY